MRIPLRQTLKGGNCSIISNIYWFVLCHIMRQLVIINTSINKRAAVVADMVRRLGWGVDDQGTYQLHPPFQIWAFHIFQLIFYCCAP